LDGAALVSETLDYLKTFAQFPFSLRRFLQHRFTLEEAKQIVLERMEHREQSFLHIAEHSIYGYSRSPYLPLLKMARCELQDLRALVKQKGLESALRELREEGVYVDFEEFKGRKPIVRNGTTIPVKARDFDNPFARRDFTVQSGGSTGTASSVGVDLDQIAARAPHEMITLAVHGVLDAPMVRWRGILPSGTLRNLLQDASFRQDPQRWFSPIALRASKHWIKYGLATYYILLCMKLSRIPAPLPEFVRVDQAIVVARCVADLLEKYHQCVLDSNLSCAMRVCIAALAAGIDLGGATFCGSAEPTTSAKVRQIESAGVTHVPHYGMMESGRIGAGCGQPTDVGDVHLYQDGFALITHPYMVEGFGVTVPAFNLTTLLPVSPKLMLNVQMDDYGIIEERNCGCEFASYGYTTHLREIRSYSKLTGEGVTLIGNEILRILEEVLPARFGGTPLDYQLLEQEDEHGFTRLYLVISPHVEIVDEKQVIDVMLQALSKSSSMADAARTVWQQTQTLQIKRMEPLMTGRGKLLPLHIQSRTKI
jgi:hypothetical protein